MEKEGVKNHHHHPHSSSTNSINTSTTSLRERHLVGESLVKPPQPADFVLQWGNRKRLRCMKTQVKNETAPVTRTTTVRVEHRAIKSDHNSTAVGSNTNHLSNGHFNLRQRSASPARLAARTLRNTENPGMKGGHNNSNGNGNGNGNNHHSNGGVRGLASPDRVEKKNGGGGHHHSSHDNMMINGGGGGGGKTTSSETKNGNSSGGGGGCGGSDVVWPPKFMIALTNKEKEEDFMAIKGSKLPQRPKKRAKFIQRTLNLVSPGGWLCDLTLERYEVREKKISKKKPRGLKAMGNYMDSDSE